MTFRIKQHDTKTALKAVLQDETGPADLAGATVQFYMSDYGGTSLINRNVDVKTGGEVWYIFQPGDTDQTGVFKAEFEATYPDGRVETFPSDGYILVEIIKDLGGKA